MTVWPWSELKRLRREERAARNSSSAAQKQVNRLIARVKVLDAACVKHHAQARHDQAYIDALEARLHEDDIKVARVVAATK